MLYIRHMIRTQVYLPKQLYQTIDLVAKKEKKPKAQVIREALEGGLGKKKPKDTIGDAFEKIIAIGKKYTPKNVPTDLSVNHDKYLYED